MSDLPYDPAWERRFWAFVAERQRVWHRRHVENRPPPWTDDPILRSYRFANVYRELDRGTRYLHDVLVPAFGAAAPPDKLWVSLVYRVVNRRETFERLGWLPRPEGAEIDRWVFDLRDLRGGGEAVFTNRHFVRGFRRYERTLRWTAARLRVLAHAVVAAPSPQAALSEILRIPEVGRFFGNQVYWDLQEEGVLCWPENSFVELGDGAVGGLIALSRGHLPKTLSVGSATRRRLYPLVHTLLRRQALVTADMDVPWYGGRMLSLKNIEHALCEWLRYELVALLGRAASPRLSRAPEEWNP